MHLTMLDAPQVSTGTIPSSPRRGNTCFFGYTQPFSTTTLRIPFAPSRHALPCRRGVPPTTSAPGATSSLLAVLELVRSAPKLQVWGKNKKASTFAVIAYSFAAKMASKAAEAERGHGPAVSRQKRSPLAPLRATEMPRASPGGSFPSVEGAANDPKSTDS